MKIFFKLLYGILFGWLSYLTVKSDLNEGKVYNKHILMFLSAGMLVDIGYYTTVGQSMFLAFIVNLVVITVIALCLFFSHSFAGGDVKLLFVLAAIYPADFYLTYNGNSLTLYITVMFAILYGYIFLAIFSIRDLINGKSKITGIYIIKYIAKFLYSFIAALVYIGILNILFLITTARGIVINSWIFRVVSLAVAYLVNNKGRFKRWHLLGPVALALVLMMIYFRVVPFSFEIENYILIILILFCQMIIKTSIYETVPITQLQDGMILSTASSMLMQNSRVRGLPQISSEDLRNRLTMEEVKSIKRWAKCRKMDHLVIVKKIPFAFFLIMGFVSYFVIWRVLK